MKQPLKTKPTPVEPRDFYVTLPPPSPKLNPDRVVYDPNDKGYISKTGFSIAAEEGDRVVTLWTFIPRDLSPPSAKQYYLDPPENFPGSWPI